MIEWDGLHLEAIAKRLVIARERLDLSQGAVARALGISRPTISWLESGAQHLRVADLLRLCELYSVDPQVILRPGYDPWPVAVVCKPREVAADDELRFKCLSCEGKGHFTKEGKPTRAKGAMPCTICGGKGMLA